jgi:hypothetical protein
MASATETAIKALIAALTTQAEGSPAPYPVPTRNNTLPARFTASVPTFSDITFFFNVNDGNGKIIQETLGQPDVTPDTYEIEHRVEIELVAQGDEDAYREAAFDTALIGINSALAVDRYLGGVVEWAQIDETVRSNLVTDALPNTKAIVVYVCLTFQSSLPF